MTMMDVDSKVGGHLSHKPGELWQDNG